MTLEMWDFAVSIETVNLEGTFCDTTQVPSSAGDMELF